ncbi:MAG: endonuclease [Candidatus Cloacimonetes bacterium]|nr:endonuclease [Candidatus Cloacimonadota bacterium]
MKKVVFSIAMLLTCVSFLCADYYDGTEGLYGDELKTALYNIIKGHTEYYYADLRDYILINTDEDPENSNNVILIYTGHSQDKDTFGGLLDEWNREHVWAKSHGDFGTTPPAGTDAHHIRPSDVGVNSIRGNKDFDYGGDPVYGYYGDFAGNTDSDSFEPRDDAKGDIARMIMYMAVRYEGENGEPDLEMVDYIPSSPDGQPYHAKESTLIQWHLDDPVDSFEMLRNEKIYTNWQHNRNPFIDHPEFAQRIWCYAIDDPSVGNVTIEAYPNPFKTLTMISFNLNSDLRELAQVKIYNMKGQLIKTLSSFPNPSLGTQSVVWDGRDENNQSIHSGIYFCVIDAGEKQIVKKLTFIQ